MIYWVFVVPVLIWIISGLRVIQEYEAGVIFRLGRSPRRSGQGSIGSCGGGPDGEGRPPHRHADVPPQDVITHDNVSLKVSA